MDLSEYILEPLRKEREFTFYRGLHKNLDQATRSSILLIAPELGRHAPSVRGQIEEEVPLNFDLNVASAVRVVGVRQHEGQPVLVLENRWGEPLETLIRQRMAVGQLLRIALMEAFEEIKRLSDRMEIENAILHDRVNDPASQALELKRLRRFMNDLSSVVAAPIRWDAARPVEAIASFLDSVVGMLNLDFFYARVMLKADERPIESLRTGGSYESNQESVQIAQFIGEWLREMRELPAKARRKIGGQDIGCVPIRLGLEGELGVLVTGSQRLSFPEPTESLVLAAAANQVAIGSQRAMLLDEKNRAVRELELRVAERTKDLTETNEELQLQVGLLQHLPVSAWTLKPDGTPDFVNRVWLEYSGQTLDFVRSHPEAWMTAVHPDDRETAARAFWEGVRSGRGFAFETRTLRAQDRTYRWHLQQAVVLRGSEGKVIRFVGTTTDIDDQKRAEEALRTSEANLRQVIDTIPTLSWCNLADGPNEFLSKSWHQYTGLSPEEAHGWGWSAAFHPDDLPTLLKRWQELLVSGEPGEIEGRLRRHDGVYRWFLIRVAPLRDESGRIIRWYGTSTDIHDRKLANESLRASENNLREILDSIPGLVCTLDPTGVIQHLNQPLMEYFGKTPEELKNWRLTDAVHPDDLPGVIKAYTYSITTGTPYEIENRCRRADGVYRWFQVRASAVRDGDGRITGWYVLLTDIDERKCAEEALESNERNLNLIINTMPVLAWSAHPDGNADFFNQRWLDYTGLAQSEADGWAWTKAFHPEDLDRVANYWESHIRSGEPCEIEARLRSFDGSYRWFLLRGSPLRDEFGTVVKWYGTNTDIDDRKRAEEELRVRELNLLQITETIPEMLWSASPNGAIEYCNGRLLDYTGVRPERIMNEGWTTLLHPADVERTARIWRSCVESGAPYRVEFRAFHAADRTFRWCVASALPLHDENGRIVRWHGTVVDMHDWKRAQEDLRATQTELARMTRVVTIGQLTASIAHEVSQPLSGIIMNANTCLRMLKSDPPNIQGARETVLRTIRDGNRASDVITRLRTLFSEKKSDLKPLDLNEVTRDVIALLADELKRTDAILKHETSDRVPAVEGDRIQLQQVLLNLVRNGLDAMERVNDRPRRLLVRTEADDNHVIVSVQDSGVGFGPEISERLFDPFFTTKEQGMGIGLSVSRSIIEAHHGRLWAVRNAGPGVTFAFSIPKYSGDFGVHQEQ